MKFFLMFFLTLLVVACGGVHNPAEEASKKSEGEAITKNDYNVEASIPVDFSSDQVKISLDFVKDDDGVEFTIPDKYKTEAWVWLIDGTVDESIKGLTHKHLYPKTGKVTVAVQVLGADGKVKMLSDNYDIKAKE